MRIKLSLRRKYAGRSQLQPARTEQYVRQPPSVPARAGDNHSGGGGLAAEFLRLNTDDRRQETAPTTNIEIPIHKYDGKRDHHKILFYILCVIMI